jgi:hypothetical protein
MSNASMLGAICHDTLLSSKLFTCAQAEAPHSIPWTMVTKSLRENKQGQDRRIGSEICNRRHLITIAWSKK